MKKAIPLGIMSYKEAIENDYYVVDKTLMIEDFLTRKNKVTLVTRPRRFGKTLNMSMMSEFFDITKDSKELFKNTKIMKTKYASYINQYPTILISFANAKGNMNNLVKEIKLQLRNEYDRYDYIFTDLTTFEKEEYDDIIHQGLKLSDNTIDNISNVLSFLMKILEKYYQKKVMVFIDEYDTPFIEAHTGGFYDSIKSSLASLLHNALKSSTSLQYGMMTGIQRVAKENIFSDLNNLSVCTVRDKQYDRYFGFTEKETRELLEYYGLELNDKVKEMYDGYHIGEQNIYNPWSIVKYAETQELIPYWLNTSANKMIKSALEKTSRGFQEEYEELILKGKVDTWVQMETSFFEASSTESLWGLFVNAGYLTIEKMIEETDGYCTIRIPNQEVQKEFKTLTSYHLKVTENELSRMFQSLIYGKEKVFKQKYKDIIMELPSYHDLKDENNYHMMMLGMSAYLKNEYEIKSNRESGKGRSDIILKAKKEMIPSYIMEFKYTKEENRELIGLAKEAIEQIESNCYGRGIEGKVIYIGLAHRKKDCEIIWQERK